MKKAAIWILCSIVVVSLVVVSLIGLGPVAAQQLRVAGPPADTAALALARYAVGLKYEDLPADVVAITKRHILDALGNALGGSTAAPMTILRNVVVSEGGPPESTIVGSGQKTSVVNATMVNGTMIRYLDYGDNYDPRNATHPNEHPSDIISAALAAAERQHASGKDLILATVLGYEIESRFVDAFNWHGFQQHSVAGFTAPVVAGKLLGLNVEQIANAIGIGGSHNFALSGIYGIGYVTNMKALGYAAGSASGVMAALLAQKGFTGPVTIIESYQRSFEKDASFTPLVGPRTDFAISKAWIKPFECEQFHAPAITGLIQLVKEHNIKPDQIEKVSVRGMPVHMATHGSLAPERLGELPRTKEDADHNVFYTTAMAIMDGTVGLDQYAKEQWKDPKVQELMRKMEFQGDAELTDKVWPDVWVCIVEITTKDKQVYTQRVDFTKGSPKNPLTDQELETKFNGQALKLMPKAQADQIIKTVFDLDKLTDVSGLTKLLIAAKM